MLWLQTGNRYHQPGPHSYFQPSEGTKSWCTYFHLSGGASACPVVPVSRKYFANIYEKISGVLSHCRDGGESLEPINIVTRYWKMISNYKHTRYTIIIESLSLIKVPGVHITLIRIINQQKIDIVDSTTTILKENLFCIHHKVIKSHQTY